MKFRLFHARSRSRRRNKENASPQDPLGLNIPPQFTSDDFYGTPLIEAAKKASTRPQVPPRRSSQSWKIDMDEVHVPDAAPKAKESHPQRVECPQPVEPPTSSSSILKRPSTDRLEKAVSIDNGTTTTMAPPPSSVGPASTTATIAATTLTAATTASPSHPPRQSSQSPPSLTSSPTSSTTSLSSFPLPPTSPSIPLATSRQAQHNLVMAFLRQYEELSGQRDKILREELEIRKATQKKIEQLIEEQDKIKNLLMVKGVITEKDFRDIKEGSNSGTQQVYIMNSNQPNQIQPNQIQPASSSRPQQPQPSQPFQPSQPSQPSQPPLQPSLPSLHQPTLPPAPFSHRGPYQMNNVPAFTGYDTFISPPSIPYAYQTHPSSQSGSYVSPPPQPSGPKFFGDQIMKDAQHEYGIYRNNLEIASSGGYVPTLLYDPVTKVNIHSMPSSRQQGTQQAYQQQQPQQSRQKQGKVTFRDAMPQKAIAG